MIEKKNDPNSGLSIAGLDNLILTTTCDGTLTAAQVALQLFALALIATQSGQVLLHTTVELT
jgi:hypothetical protein